MKPQAHAVLSLLQRYGERGVTQQDAIREIACYRLAARISDLRADGITVRSELVGSNGHRYARYHLVEQPEQMAVGW